MNPLVSVIIPTYNRCTLVKESILSVLNQNYTNFELLVVDDGSTDNTVEELASIEDGRLILVKNKRKKGAQGARNTGILLSKGDFIAFLDSDDLWLPKKLEEQISLMLLKNSHFSFTNRFILKKDKKRHFKINEKNLHLKNYVGTFSGVVISSEIQKKVGLLDESLSSCQDWDYWLRISKFEKPYMVKSYLLIYSEGGHARISTNKEKLLKGHEILYRKHIEGKVKSKKVIAKHFYMQGLFSTSHKKRRGFLLRSFFIYPSIKTIIRLVQYAF